MGLSLRYSYYTYDYYYRAKPSNYTRIIKWKKSFLLFDLRA